MTFKNADTTGKYCYVSKFTCNQLIYTQYTVENVELNKKKMGSGVKAFKETAVASRLPAGRYVERKIFIDNAFIVDLKFRGLKET